MIRCRGCDKEMQEETFDGLCTPCHNNGTCAEKGCERPRSSRGLCKPHYDLLRRQGGVPPRPKFATTEERFWSKVVKSAPNGCWEWTASVRRGYGTFYPKSDAVQAHRYAYEITIGPIPEGLDLDHLCRNRKCVNPSHLEPVTRGENVLRGIGPAAQNARATHCAKGHPFDEANTYRLTYKGGAVRVCRTCRRNRRREARARRRAA